MKKKIIDFLKDEYRFILILFLLYLVFTWPLNYYIITGGGISDISSRIKVEDGYKAKGSLNISYVQEIKGEVGTYLLSYIMPNWKRENADLYKYSKSDSLADIEFRNDLDLKMANNSAITVAYSLANKTYKVTSTKIYVYSIMDKYKSNLKVGDQILSINDKTYDNLEDYHNLIQALNVGDYVKIKVLRNDKEKIVTSKIYDYQGKKIMGVILSIIHTYKTNPKISIKFNSDESGPSGGLISTLAIYNQLTKKDLTKGRVIAGTGTVDDLGNVGEIGGVKYKLLGAASKGASIFIMPKANYKECVKVKKKNNLQIKLIPVKTVKEAITKLK